MNIRKLEFKDAKFMLEWMHDKTVVKDLAGNFLAKSLDDCESFIAASQDTSTNMHWAIVDSTDEYMGTVSLKHVTEKNAEFAITIRKSAMGQGYSKYAMNRVIQIGIEELGLNEIYWCVSPINARAVKFYDKNGYERITNNVLPETVRNLGTYSEEQITKYIWYTVRRQTYSMST